MRFITSNSIEDLSTQIISVLKKYQNEPLDGYFIAKIEVIKFENEALGIVYKRISSQSNSATIFDKLSDFQLLKAILIKSENKFLPKKKPEFVTESQFYQTTFSETELTNYLIFSGDKNPIHFGENAIVPGILVLQNYFRKIRQSPDFFSIKFHNPLYLQKQLNVYKIAKNEAIGFCESHLVFQINLK